MIMEFNWMAASWPYIESLIYAKDNLTKWLFKQTLVGT